MPVATDYTTQKNTKIMNVVERNSGEPSVALDVELGSGTYGSVRRAFVRGVPSLDAHYKHNALAIKTYKNSKGANGVPQMQLREVLAMQSIPFHHQIMPMLGCIVEETENNVSMHIIMPCANETAFQAAAMKELTEINIFRWCYQLASAVAHMHEHGWIHRDIKLENCMIYSNQLVLGDLGLTRLRFGDAASPTQNTTAFRRPSMTSDVCTENTRAPEMFVASVLSSPTTTSYDYSSDVWSMGVSCLALATGRYIFKRSEARGESVQSAIMRILGTSSTKKQCASSIDDIKAVTPRYDICDAWWKCIDRMLRIDPKERVTAATAAQMFNLLIHTNEHNDNDNTRIVGGNNDVFLSRRKSLVWYALGKNAHFISGNKPSSFNDDIIANSDRSEDESRILVRTLENCWEACRTLNLPPLVGIAAQLLLARVLTHRKTPSNATLAATVAACILLCAKSCMFQAPSLKSVAFTLHTLPDSVARSEWSIFKNVRGILLCDNFRKAIRIWPPTQRLHLAGGNSLQVCISFALLALFPNTDIDEIVFDANMISRGASPSACIIRGLKLINAIQSNSTIAFFRSWPGAWIDSSGTMKTWANIK